MSDLTELLSHAAAIVGKIGTGKTYVAKGVVERLLSLGRRVVIIDPTGVWYGLRSGRDGSETGGFPIMIFGGEHADVPITDQGGKALALAIAEREVQCIIDLSEMTGGEKVRFMTPFLEHLYAKNRAALHLVVDEADEIAAQRLADGEQRMFGAFDKIVRRGRVKGFRPLMISQRPAVIHKNVLSQIGTLIALQLTSPQDRKAIDDWVKGNADVDQAKAVMSSLPTLPRGEGWVWSPANDVLERVEFPPIRTFDSSRTPEAGETLVRPALSHVDVEELRATMVPAETTEPARNMRADMRAEIEAAERRGYERGLKQGRDEGVDHGKTVGAAAALTAVRNALNALRIPDIAADAASSVFPIVGSPSGKGKGVISPGAGSNPAPATRLPLRPDNRFYRVPAPEASSALGAERKPLAVLVAAHPAAYTEAQWASLAGFKRTGGTWGTYKSRLRTKGMIEQDGDLWRATETAVSAIGGDLPPMPTTPEERLAMWKTKVAGVGPMLDVFHAAYPASLHREELAERIGLSASGGTFGTYLSRLRSNSLIEEPTKGFFRLSSAIMGETRHG